MTFKPGPLPTFAAAAHPTPTKSVVDMQKAKKSVSGLAAAQILKRKYHGLVRPKNQEPWNAEKLLLVSAWGAESALDITPATIPYNRKMTLDECKVFEPGTVKYYVVLLPGSEDSRRPLGDTPIACAHLAEGKGFDSLEEALEEYGDE